MKGKKKIQPGSPSKIAKETKKKTNKKQKPEEVEDENDLDNNIQTYNRLHNKKSTLINMSKNTFSYLIRFLSWDDQLQMLRTNKRLKNLVKSVSQLLPKVLNFKDYLKKENISQLKCEIHLKKAFVSKLIVKWQGNNISKTEIDHLIQELLCFLSEKELIIYEGMYEGIFEGDYYLLDTIIKSPKCPFEKVIIKQNDYDAIYDVLANLVKNSQKLTKIVFKNYEFNSPNLKPFLKAIKHSKVLQELEIRKREDVISYFRNSSHLFDCIENGLFKTLTLKVSEPKLSELICEALYRNESIKTLNLKKEVYDFNFLFCNTTLEILNYDYFLNNLDLVLPEEIISFGENVTSTLKTLTFNNLEKCPNNLSAISTLISHSAIEKLCLKFAKKGGDLDLNNFFTNLVNSNLTSLSLTNLNIGGNSLLLLLRHISNNPKFEELDLRNSTISINVNEFNQATDYLENNNVMNVLKLSDKSPLMMNYAKTRIKKLDNYFDA